MILAMNRRHIINLIGSNVQKRLNLNATVNVKALAVSGDIPRYEIVAYTGGFLNLASLPLPVVIDLSDTVVAPRIPWLFNHSQIDIIGHHENVEIILPDLIRSIGVMSGVSEWAEEVKATSRNGFQWNVSIGVESENLIKLEAGESAQVNGQTWNGPCFVARQNTVREISCVSIGADAQAYAKLVASYGATSMTFEEWLKSLNVDMTTLMPEQVDVAKKLFEAIQAQTQNNDSTDATANADAAAQAAATANAAAVQASANLIRSNTTATTTTTDAANNPSAILTAALANVRTETANEINRIGHVNRLSGQYGNPVFNGVSIAASAIRDGWNLERTELAMLRAARPQGIQAGGRNGSNEGKDMFIVLEAALAVACRVKNVDKIYTPQVLDAAHKKYKGRIGVQQLLIEAAYAAGYTGSINFNANIKPILQAAFSTFDIPNILVSQVQKKLVEGFAAVDDSWRGLSAIGSVSDFKEVSGYRGIGSFRFEKIAPDGHIPHGTISETGYGNRAETSGKMFAITRQDLINDDLNFFSSIPRGLGRGGALALIHEFWTEFMDNAAFFVAGNNNVSTGALGITGLNNALAKFRKLTDENGDYVFHNPAFLVVPPELEVTANDMYNATQLITGEAVTRTADNPHGKKYQPIISPYLSDSRFTGFSTTAYYLIADPNDVPVIEVVFLDGVETPTVESADVDFSQLGIQFRGYFDFGVRKQEPRGGVRSTGV